MTSGSRSSIVSSFTIIKGAIIDETYAVFSTWDFQVSKRENLDRLRNTNFIGASSATWLRDVAKVLNRRFDPEKRDRPLVLLAKQGLSIEKWKPLLLWHLTRDEFLVRDFLETWLFSAYEGGAFRVRPQEVESYLSDIDKRGAITEHAWSDQTKKRVAAGLLKMAADFDLLRGSVTKEFASYHLPEQTFMYILHAMRDSGLSPGKMILSPAWRLFLVRPSDVEHEVLRLHQFRKLEYHVAGSIVQLDLPCASAHEYAERMFA
ncbi:DUF1819 family protein [Paraburkholderia strydomiana]|uniref:BrxA family protein n=1 Tax=Paraburkholderia strydomiana TaxID=1245417 RepID=UPI0038BD1308